MVASHLVIHRLEAMSLASLSTRLALHILVSSSSPPYLPTMLPSPGALDEGMRLRSEDVAWSDSTSSPHLSLVT